jgi:hypothetical protein
MDEPEGNIHLNARTHEKLELLDSIVQMIFAAAGDGALEVAGALAMVEFVESWRQEVKSIRDDWVDPSHWEMASRN